jgi:hypothetical protein
VAAAVSPGDAPAATSASAVSNIAPGGSMIARGQPFSRSPSPTAGPRRRA